VIETILERTDAKEGYLILSKKLADSLRALEHLEKAFATQAFVSGKITEKTKNGYTVNVGIDAFLPDSHADIKIVREPEKLVGQTFKFKVVKFDRKTENAVLSRKLFLQDEREKKKRRVFGRLVKGKGRGESARPASAPSLTWGESKASSISPTCHGGRPAIRPTSSPPGRKSRWLSSTSTKGTSASLSATSS
jgi:hypothetical protein